MLTRIALLFSVLWLANLREPLFALFGKGISSRDLVLFAGGAFLVVKERNGDSRHADRQEAPSAKRG